MKHIKHTFLLFLSLLGIFLIVQKKKSFAFEFSSRSIMEYLSTEGNFNQFSSLLIEAGVDAWLNKVNLVGAENGFTVFAPTDQALANFGYVGILRDKKLLTDFVGFHVVSGIVPRNQVMRKGVRFKTFAKDQFLDPDALEAHATKILNKVELANGVIYVIDTVLVNPSVRKTIPSIQAAPSPLPLPGQSYTNWKPNKP